MKKTIAIILSLALVMVCGTTNVLAANNKESSKESTSTKNARNIDYYTWGDGYVQSGTTYVKVTPGRGQNLKIHLYLKSGNVSISIKSSTGSYRYIAMWNTNGHHYADLVSPTDGGTYTVQLSSPGAPAWFSGGIYSE